MVQIKTKRLTIREFKPGNWKAVNEYTSAPHVVRYVPFGPSKAADTKKFISKAIHERKKKYRADYNLAIIHNKTGKLIGGCSISIKDIKNRRASIGYMLNPLHWNKGYITEAIKALIGFCFEELKLHRLTAVCRPANLASKRVMEKVGMKHEAHYKKHIFYKGKWHDSLLYAILE